MKSCLASHSLIRATLSLLLCAASAACVRIVSFPSGPISISGLVSDAAGLPLANKTVRLSQDGKYAETTTDAKGAYAFPSLAPGSYTVRPRLDDCTFLPPSADLDRLTTSVVQNFGGFGPACGGEPTVNMGAMTGALTVSGHIRDSAGRAVVGARVDLDDDTRAIRFTDLTGGYAFHVRSEEYKLRATGACTFTPAGTVKKDVKANLVLDFAAGSGCATASQSNVTATGSVLTVEQGGKVLGRTYVRIDERSSPADALAQLSDITSEQPTFPPRSLSIAGNPAIERQTTVSLSGPTQEISGGSGAKPAPFLAITTAIVVANTVIRFESQLETADAATIARFLQVGRNFTADQIPDLHGPAPTPNPMTTFAPGPPPVAPGISAAGVVAGGLFGELQVAAFDTVNVIVYGTPNGPFFSTNGGQTAQTSTFNTVAAPPAAAFVSLGDPTVAIGAPNASFAQTAYYAQLQQVAAAAGGANKPTVAIGLYQSANGSTFNNLGFPRNCSVAAQGCVVPDQEQLASDRINRAVTATGSFDQLYLAWRNFTSPTTNSMTVAVACSQDNGANWTVDLTTLAKSGADFPRLAVGPDGTLLVAYSVISGSGATYSLRTQKWGSCASGFRPGDSATVGKSAVTEVTDMPGLDRPPKGNYAPAWENTFRVFVVYANEASAGNDDIHVAESVDAGKTWDRDSIVSKNGTGRRYFPWVCSTVGKNFVSWYDRRGSTAANPDLTAYFRSSVFDNGSTSTVGVGPEVNVSGVNDAQCAPGFPNQVRGATEITACTGLPGGFIQGGTCQFTCAPGVAGPCGSGRACDFRAANPCPALPPPAPAESCTAGNLGQPKYGDYNGAACALGTLFVAWTSATPASGATCLVNGLPATSASQCCSGVLSGGTCAATAAACVANGGACGPATTCCSATAGGRCQAGQCMPAITMYTGSSCLGPGCAGAPVKITYHQTGACNGFVIPTGAVSAGPNAAYVIFGIERIDNSLGTTTFNFDPDRIFVQQTGPRKFDSFLSLYANVLGPFAVTTQTFAPGANSGFAVSAQGATVVTTTNADGAVEANQTAYFLQYDRQPSDPQITFVKSDAARTSWPLTRDCKTIVLK